jgi:small subunit ribosomal protein S6
MRHYELMVILDPELEERTVTPSLETYLKIIKDSGGTVNKLDLWGKRRMSFEILKKGEGIYAQRLSVPNNPQLGSVAP